MASYKPPADTFMGKILKNATALFFILIVSLFAGTFFFLKTNRNTTNASAFDSKKSNLSQRHYLRDESAEIEVSGDMKPSEESTASGEARVQTADASSTTAAKAIKDQSPDEIRENLESQLFRKDPAAAKDASTRFDVKIYFAEVSAKGMDMLIQEARANGHSSNTDFAQGVVNMPITKILSYRDDISVYSEISKAIEKNKPADWFQGLKSGGKGSDVGLDYALLVKDGNNGYPAIEIKITRKTIYTQPDGLKSAATIDFVGGGEIDKDQTYFAAEILSKDPMSPQHEYLITMSPFEIYKSQNFVNGKSFSVFFYTIENK